jgi:hypothetical protein
MECFENEIDHSNQNIEIGLVVHPNAEASEDIRKYNVNHIQVL